jgi:hypothetical protein
MVFNRKDERVMVDMLLAEFAYRLYGFLEVDLFT